MIAFSRIFYDGKFALSTLEISNAARRDKFMETTTNRQTDPMNCAGSRVVHTIGHSTSSLPDFLALLAHHGLRGIADVRRFPASRRHPHFAREPLAAALADAGIAYDWLPGLGGRRRGRADSPHVAWRSAAFA